MFNSSRRDSTTNITLTSCKVDHDNSTGHNTFHTQLSNVPSGSALPLCKKIEVDTFGQTFNKGIHHFDANCSTTAPTISFDLVLDKKSVNVQLDALARGVTKAIGSGFNFTQDTCTIDKSGMLLIYLQSHSC